jgi:phosphonate transport system substrate-binding protein
MSRISKIITIIILTLCLAKISIGADGTKGDPFNVLLVPADGGTEEGTISDFKPIFNAISLATNYSFNIKLKDFQIIPIRNFKNDIIVILNNQ